MMNNGVSRNKAWDYVVTEYTQGQMSNHSSTFGSPRLGGLGGGVGYGLAHGIQAGMSLRNMRGEVNQLTAQICPQYSGASRVPTNEEHINNSVNMIPTPWLDDFTPMTSKPEWPKKVEPSKESTEQRLQELESLKEKGLITDEEYKAMRKKALGL